MSYLYYTYKLLYIFWPPPPPVDFVLRAYIFLKTAVGPRWGPGVRQEGQGPFPLLAEAGEDRSCDVAGGRLASAKLRRSIGQGRPHPRAACRRLLPSPLRNFARVQITAREREGLHVPVG
jgi:hypothetical protein